ncbi:hypothetical protein [Nocardia amikacinitolerans]|uniref:hypothetical protein n=1 Tax=Nocardia amikacinitolerans TaxID=756689 RepID=UPI0020A3E943|nr:hypothetical protein [Nocardia amikacinitolerans]MCP2289349.1 hypothetical protein [Nocardia amikacinitolerans]
MFARLLRVVETVQGQYLHDPHLADDDARRAFAWRLVEKAERIAGEILDKRGIVPGGPGLETVQAALRAFSEAEDQVIKSDIIGRIPARAVHERYNAWAYKEADFSMPIEPAQVDTGAATAEFWRQRAAESHVDVDRVGDSPSYTGFDPIEDVALEPIVHWTEADKKAALEKAVEGGLEPGEWIDLDWPPQGFLYSEGYTYQTEFSPCLAHEDAYGESGDETSFENCEDCRQSETVVEENAKWRFTTTMWLYEVDFDENGDERIPQGYAENGFEVRVIEQDPRDIMIGPPGAGRYW